MKNNVDELISMIEKISNKPLFDYQKKMLKIILKSKQHQSKIILSRTRGNGFYYGTTPKSIVFDEIHEIELKELKDVIK